MNEEELSQAFDKVIRTRGKGAFDLGAYNTLGVAQAASAKGLVDCNVGSQPSCHCAMAFPNTSH
jgi:hypothetical protein